jgi:hypothetical protein
VSLHCNLCLFMHHILCFSQQAICLKIIIWLLLYPEKSAYATVSKRDFFDFRKLRQRSPNCKPGCITFSPQRLLRKWQIFTCHFCESGVPFSLRIMLKFGTNWVQIGYKYTDCWVKKFRIF